MKFSIVTPVFNGEKTIARAIRSVQSQSFENFEHIIVNDFSTDRTSSIVEDFVKYDSRIRLIENEKHYHKAVTRNNGMKQAKGDFICWLDADDFYLPFYLEVMNQAIEKFPEYGIFYFGSVVFWNNWKSTFRMPLVHHQGEIFKSGDVSSGGFIFKRELWIPDTMIPETNSPYTFGKMLKLKFPELEQLYSDRDDLGNPWGDDWAQFYMLTRKHEPQRLDVAPYVVMIRGEKKL